MPDESSTPSDNTLIRVRVSGDNYQGDPHFQLLIDGQQVGATQTVSAAHSSGQWQIVEFSIPGSVAFDELSVRFNNDAYGGCGHDRNLYVDWVEINGVQLSSTDAIYERHGKTTIDGQSTMAWNGSLVFDVSDRSDLFSTTDRAATRSSSNQAPTAVDDTLITDLDTAITFDALCQRQ